jgi:hypothetical protein
VERVGVDYACAKACDDDLYITQREEQFKRHIAPNCQLVNAAQHSIKGDSNIETLPKLANYRRPLFPLAPDKKPDMGIDLGVSVADK